MSARTYRGDVLAGVLVGGGLALLVTGPPWWTWLNYAGLLLLWAGAAVVWWRHP